MADQVTRKPAKGGRPKTFSERAKTVSVRLEPEELAAVDAFRTKGHWDRSVAIRLILAEKLLGKKLPF